MKTWAAVIVVTGYALVAAGAAPAPTPAGSISPEEKAVYDGGPGVLAG